MYYGIKILIYIRFLKDKMNHNISPLNIQNLVVKYGDFTAVKGLNLKLEAGEIFGLLGPNGAGKTSTIACIVTLEKPESGEIEIFGKNVVKDTLAAKKLIGYVPQEVINHGFFSVLEIMGFHSGYYGLNNNWEYINYILDRLGLAEHKNKKVKQLSGGMKRRLMIAKALVHKPKLVLLDEPTAGVDIQLRSSLWDFVKELKAEGVTILLTTHYLEEAEALCDRISVIHQNELLRIGPTQNLIQDLTQRFLKIEFNQPVAIKHEYLHEVQNQSLVFKIPSNSKVGDILRDLGDKVACIEDIHVVEGNLEEAFKVILGAK
jgi:ABC-2 type transport system ATP-binding protein